MLKSRFNIFLISSFLTILSVDGEFPIELKPCKHGDTECIQKAINYLLSEKYEGDDSLNLMKIDPMLVKSARIQQGEESPVSIDLLLTNNYIHGWKTAKVVKVKGFDKDLTRKHQLIFHVDSLSLIGPYQIDGKVLILPIKGSGNSNITMVDVTVKMEFVGTPLEKDGATYMTIDKLTLDADPKEITYSVDNLFNGDKALSDNMNLFLNENWKDIYGELRETLAQAFADIYREVINNVFAKYPYEKLFAE